MVMSIDFGAHQRLKSSGFVQASNSIRAGASKVRVTPIARSDFRSTVVRLRAGMLALLASIELLLPFQFFDDLVQRIEARVPELVITLDPCRHFGKPAQAELAGAYAPDFFRDDEPGLLEDADVFLHAREGQVEPVGEVRDGRVRAPELLEDATAGGGRGGGRAAWRGRG